MEEENIYFYTCMGCGRQWESLKDDIVLCPCCGVADIAVEEVEDDE